ncbi:hypothetical protein HOT95_gp131 [Vibrio phage vB_VpS_PG07]|uniref:Uncharacterized protein n=3 Tax=Pogseptimavirus TaxID=2732037 RepID=A0A411BKU0_9CAUD|nr:hypothetical protein HOT95_gp131 [Vibrio phage vB_VpS_PG07]YP_009819667.1 hypothetical protein HOV08_gp156 [Vibrio phage VspSw_1]AXQ66756.1 hypothetical protein [Vibrio phage vB_VpS_PG07]QAY02223.1 hypothetical protein VspSw1_156 [Vibrio phage VspSw_1]QKN88555.1 hypothetical protein vBValSX1_162 [Vibrio phage vB_ValS_X1]
MSLNLANIILDTKTMTFDHPEFEGLTITLTYNSKSRLSELRKSCLETKYDPSVGAPIQKLNIEKWNEVFCKEVISTWSGFKYKYLAQMLLINESAVELEDELEFTVENATTLLTQSNTFDSWVNSCLADLNNFRG